MNIAFDSFGVLSKTCLHPVNGVNTSNAFAGEYLTCWSRQVSASPKCKTNIYSGINCIKLMCKSLLFSCSNTARTT